ncbi:protein serine/threonine phosphatase 2C [Hypoxylon sp. FL1284]|nr:protein serine/threonine phosphatase 2C [Hypoxylon sp. FL1284]
MFARHLLRPRARLPAATSLSCRPSRVVARHASTNSLKESPSTRRVGIYTTAGLASAALVYSITSGSRQNAAPAGSKTLKTKANAVPDLNEFGLSDQISFNPVPTSEDVTRQLNEHAFSLSGAAPVSRYDGAQLASNSPCEDALVHGTFADPFDAGRQPWSAWGVFDGHCGWQMSQLLTRQLVPHVRRALAAAQPGRDGVEAALAAAFTALDDAVVRSATDTIDNDGLSFAEKARRLEAAYAGACALLALYDPLAQTVTVASTGDCRAVLGRQTADGKWATTELTTDCTGANASEAARIRAQFPNEPDVVKGGRVWGMQPSRTFGDGMWKWSAALKDRLRDSFNGLSLPSAVRYAGYREGPYLTAEPLVTTTSVVGPPSESASEGSAKSPQPSFLILATDGLWDMMTSEQAVDLVGRWLDWQAGGSSKKPVLPDASGFGPTVLGRVQQCRYEARKATLQDDNAAVHLVRNGLGGGDGELVRGALTFRYPNSRDIRDDITVQVVFFNPPSPKGK